MRVADLNKELKDTRKEDLYCFTDITGFDMIMTPMSFIRNYGNIEIEIPNNKYPDLISVHLYFCK